MCEEVTKLRFQLIYRLRGLAIYTRKNIRKLLAKKLFYAFFTNRGMSETTVCNDRTTTVVCRVSIRPRRVFLQLLLSANRLIFIY